MRRLPLALLAASAPLGAEVLVFEAPTVGSAPLGWEIAQTDGGAAPRVTYFDHFEVRAAAR